LYFPPLWCSTGTTKLESLPLILERVQYVGQDRKLISKKLENTTILYELWCERSSILKVPISVLILDESQYIKNKNSKIFKAINQIKTTKFLSGTLSKTH
jgi:SNF2 family DNA or RNA helicase